MKLTEATTYMRDLSFELKQVNNLIRDIASLSNMRDSIRVTLDKEDVEIGYNTHSSCFTVEFSKDITLNALQEQRKVLYTELIKTKETISKLLEEKQ
ncbi:hypothetical protein N2D48_11865 [Enterococcus faecium]|nr:hypothetical protein [Enterococcus faecium]MCU2181869.1 hypothetical protein [Enterococcus faecium]MCZ2005910.1 hypothetical protein [Enterococcus faecium]HAQ9529288.1 hypothetical protein [Enterococcus faecium]HAQ9727497.1 hypothetical protein [Enterococcus faecium]